MVFFDFTLLPRIVTSLLFLVGSFQIVCTDHHGGVPGLVHEVHLLLKLPVKAIMSQHLHVDLLVLILRLVWFLLLPHLDLPLDVLVDLVPLAALHLAPRPPR